ncbi:MAG: end-binding protein Ku [Chthoniobacter sp.]|jgi:DNA end-binding protein Ku|nr:end-binding protein Ku [Chthoniobacter sp.]
MRSIWKGSINFGLVYIPVAVYPATREEKISFKQLRKTDLSPIRYKKVAEVDQKEVPAADIVKGYEYEKGRWITLKDEDFEKVKIESTHSVEITDFVEQAQINPKFFYKPYFLEAQKGGEKAYSLLHKALSDTGKIGIAKVAISSREYLAAVKPDGLFLILELMHFAHEVLEPETLKSAAEKEVAPKELEMAKALIETMTTEWEPTKYKDQYQTAVMEMIEEKAQNRSSSSKPQTPAVKSNVVDLVAVLQESLRKQSAKPKTMRRSTATLVRQKKRAA